jgi:RNA polymerase sigma-70 factor, ECF subfamily
VKSSYTKLESEAELITRAQKGDREAFRTLVMNNHAAVYTLVYRMTGSGDLSDDATQQAFIQAWLHLPSYRPQSSLRAWLSRIAMNACLDALRREKRISPDEDTLQYTADPLPGPETSLMNKQREQTIQQALLSLNESSRSVLVLREYNGMSYQEIADVLNIPLGTVMSRLNTARLQLRNILAPMLKDIEVVYG